MLKTDFSILSSACAAHDRIKFNIFDIYILQKILPIQSHSRTLFLSLFSYFISTNIRYFLNKNIRMREIFLSTTGIYGFVKSSPLMVTRLFMSRSRIVQFMKMMLIIKNGSL